MKEKTEKKIGLMLVEDPGETISTLCELKKETDNVTRDDFIIEYKKIKNFNSMQSTNLKKMTDSNIDAHFYTLTTFNFLIKTETEYKLSQDSKKLCTYKKKHQWIDYQKLLSEILLKNQRKGKLYREFLKFVQITKTKDEIFKFFDEVPSKTMIAWSKHAGLIIEYKERIHALQRKGELPSLKDFTAILIKKYQQLDHSEVFGIRNIFVPIGELRFLICIDLEIYREDFDKLFNELLLTDFGPKIDLHGTTSKVFREEESETFEFMGKLYIFMSLKQ